MSNLIWIQAVCHSDDNPEIFFRKKVRKRPQNIMKITKHAKELNYVLSKLHDTTLRTYMNKPDHDILVLIYRMRSCDGSGEHAH